jgi:hypothetical protein
VEQHSLYVAHEKPVHEVITAPPSIMVPASIVVPASAGATWQVPL